MRKICAYIPLVLILAFSTAVCKVLDPGSDDYGKYEKARSLYQTGDCEQARNILYKMVSEYDTDPGLNYLLAQCFRKLGGTHYRNYARKYMKAAVQLEKDSLDWKYHLGTLYKQSNMDQSALDEFSELIELDSNYYKAWLEVIDLCITNFCHNGNTGKLRKAYNYSIFGLARFKNDNALLYKKALVAMLFKSYEDAVLVLDKINDPDTLVTEITLLDACLNYHHRQFGRSLSLFEKALHMMPDSVKSGYGDLTLLLSPGEKNNYESMPDSLKKIYAEKYWEGLDPDPTTSANEKLVEHYARVYFAELRFSLPESGLHGWETDQGELYIRYGPPVYAKWHLPEDEDIKLNCRWEWIYVIDGEPIHLNFLNMFGGNNYHIAPIGHGSDDRKAYEMKCETPNMVTFAHEEELIEAVFSYFIYKGEGNISMLDLFVATPYDQFVYEPKDGHAVCDVEYRTVLRDLDGNPLRYDSSYQKLVISPTLSRNPEIYNFATVTVQAPADSLKVACAIEQKSAQRVNIYEQGLCIYDFADRGFHLSSLILGSKISPEKKNSPFNRRDFELIPNFTRNYRRSDTLIVYYEIYDLPTDIRGRTHYQMSYSIRQEKTPGNILGMIADILVPDRGSEITHIAERGDIRSNLYEPLKIDISSLEPGLYEFTLTIEEYVLGKILARKARFSVVEDKKD